MGELIMKKTIITSLVAIAAFGFAGTAHADSFATYSSLNTLSAGTDDPNGVSYGYSYDWGGVSSSCCNGSSAVGSYTEIDAFGVGDGSLSAVSGFQGKAEQGANSSFATAAGIAASSNSGLTNYGYPVVDVSVDGGAYAQSSSYASYSWMTVWGGSTSW
ncbi:MAG TPA: hypothetical protein DEB17_03140 [Chlorobaculum sp.]|uniref:Uncharacterized protein n=2 Tax=Chlorobaculum tepidum TaxID=1097 RepID=Q8KE63_CHLTE|nr:hypothetical protein CT0827 [Chlorobaculum tepidum TLS]HBU22981.1 hypothetical protein [Chlorobaculum sp.]